MDEPFAPSDTSPQITIWKVASWRCELWGPPDAGWLVLFNGEEEALRRPAKGPDVVDEVASEWLQRFTGDLPSTGIAEPSRRRLSERRSAPRGGRRSGEHRGE